MARRTSKLPRKQAAAAATNARETRRFLVRIRREDTQHDQKYQAWLQESVAAIYLNAWTWENGSWGIDAFVRLAEVQALPRPPTSGRRVYKAQLFIAFGPHKGSAIWKATELLHAARSDPAAFRDTLLAHGVYKAAKRFLPASTGMLNEESNLNEAGDRDGSMNLEEDSDLEKAKINQDGTENPGEESKNSEPSISGSVPPSFTKRFGPPKRPPSIVNTAQLELFIERDRVEVGDVILVAVKEIVDQDHDYQSLVVSWEHNF